MTMKCDNCGEMCDHLTVITDESDPYFQKGVRLCDKCLKALMKASKGKGV